MNIKKGTILYRGAISVEEKPKPRKCEDTGKVGVYFSCFHPYLAETMCVEYENDLYIGMYEVTEDIENVSNGKYAFTNGYTGRYSKRWNDVPPEDNLSHIDFFVYPVSSRICGCKEKHAELFLTEKDLSKIKYLGSYKMTLDECRKKWCVNGGELCINFDEDNILKEQWEEEMWMN